MPVAESQIELHGEVPVSLALGSSDNWFVERQILDADGEVTPTSSKKMKSGTTVASVTIPPQIRVNRSGWFITPHPSHRMARKMIGFAVVVLILAIAIHVLEPVLVRWGVMSDAVAGSFKFGLLDYPVLMVLVSPLILVPLIMRMTANVTDLRRQQSFLAAPPPAPIIQVGPNIKSDVALKIKVKWSELPTDWVALNARVQVGMPTPERKAHIRALGRTPGGQPPLGLSTELPPRWQGADEDGTGVGESTPLANPTTRERLFLEPLRVKARGETVEVDLESGQAILPLPEGSWPGSEYSALISFHWELVLQVERRHGFPLLWVEPLLMQPGAGPFEVAQLPIQSGRLEMSGTAAV
jgi:hypothetical protein